METGTQKDPEVGVKEGQGSRGGTGYLFLCNKLTKAELLHQQTFIISVSWGQESRCGLARCPQAEGLLWGGGALLPLAKAVLSTEGSTGGESSSELTLAVTDRSQFQSSWLEPSPASQGISTGQLASYRAGKVEEGA